MTAPLQAEALELTREQLKALTKSWLSDIQSNFLTEKELIAILRLSATTFRELKEDGIIPYIPITNRNHRYNLEHVTTALIKHRGENYDQSILLKLDV